MHEVEIFGDFIFLFYRNANKIGES